MQLSFSDSDTTGDSTEDIRTQSDYDESWLLGLVKQVDVYLRAHCTEPRVMSSWGAVQNMIALQQQSIRDLRQSLEEAEDRALRVAHARHNADVELMHLRDFITAEIGALCMSDEE